MEASYPIAKHLRLSTCHALLDNLLVISHLRLPADCHGKIAPGNELVRNSANSDFAACNVARGHEAGASKPLESRYRPFAPSLALPKLRKSLQPHTTFSSTSHTLTSTSHILLQNPTPTSPRSPWSTHSTGACQRRLSSAKYSLRTSLTSS